MALNRRVQQLKAEQLSMKKRLVRIENRNLDWSLIFRGVIEEYKETEQQIWHKLHLILSAIMQGETPEEKLEGARKITIRNCRQLGRFNRNRVRPLSVVLLHKQDIEYILENRMDLERGVYVDCKYPLEIERKRKTLLHIL